MTNELRNRQMCGKKQIAQKTQERNATKIAWIEIMVCEMENPFSDRYLNISILNERSERSERHRRIQCMRKSLCLSFIHHVAVECIFVIYIVRMRTNIFPLTEANSQNNNNNNVYGHDDDNDNGGGSYADENTLMLFASEQTHTRISYKPDGLSEILISPKRRNTHKAKGKKEWT